MAPVAAAVANARICAPQHERLPRELDQAVAPQSGPTTVRRAQPEHVARLLELAEGLIGCRLASEDAVKKVVLHHPDSVWAFQHKWTVVGVFSMLVLNSRGLESVLTGSMDARNPSTKLLATPDEVPAAIYLWAIAHTSASDGILKMFARLRSAPYERADIYGGCVTASGIHFLRSWGFNLIPGHPRDLYRYIRLANRPH